MDSYNYLVIAMKLIPLTRGLFAKVDDADFGRLSQWTWFAAPSRRKSGYVYYAARHGGFGETHVSMAREILGLKKGDTRDANHRYGDTLDNRRSELQIVTRSEKTRNTKWHKMLEANPTRLTDAATLASLLCVSKGIIMHWVKRYGMPAYKMGPMYCFDIQEVDVWAAKNEWMREHLRIIEKCKSPFASVAGYT